MKYFNLLTIIILLNSCSMIKTLPDISNSLSGFSEMIIPSYKEDLNQGSVIRVDKFSLIKPGMTSNEVIGLIGSPSIVDGFHSNQWEYIHYSILKDKTKIFFRITLLFENDKLAEIKKENFDNVAIVEKNNPDFSSIRKEEVSPKAKSWFNFW